jgi:hypothetical protein
VVRDDVHPVPDRKLGDGFGAGRIHHADLLVEPGGGDRNGIENVAKPAIGEETRLGQGRDRDATEMAAMRNDTIRRAIEVDVRSSIALILEALPGTAVIVT